MAFCGRFWRSTLVCTVLLLVDVVIVIGGLNFAVLGEAYWFLWGGARWGLWNPPTHSLEALILLWLLRLTTLGRLVLSFGVARLVATFRANRYTCAADRAKRMVQWMMLLSCWRNLLYFSQLVTFWLGYTQLMAYSPRTWHPRDVVTWVTELVGNGIVGPAPLIVLGSGVLDLLTWAMALYYRRRHEQWHKFNADISNYFATTQHHI